MRQGTVKGMLRRTALWVVVLALAAGLASQAAAQAPVRLTVYTALENDQLGPYKAAFEADNPGIVIDWVRDSTGVVTARLLAERANPRADVIWGLAATSMIIFEEHNMLEPYTPRGAEALKPQFRSPRTPMTWTGMDAWLSVICFNTREAVRRNIRQPKSWKDLLNPIYKDQISMPNPNSSGTGFLTIAAWLQLFGEDEAWKFMDQLHTNVAFYTHSGSAPCVRAARGEHALGIGFDMRGARLKQEGAPIDVILPREGAGWDMEATAIHRGTRNLAAARRLADWSVSRKANEMYNEWYAIVALPGVANIPPFYPPDGEAKMIKNDFGWMAKNRDRILREWGRRFESGKRTI
ncbi:MAG: putative 2-aminoethylphosphonate ABC transporter substrate-binding protein [Armatimonadota bacterium]|nr:putative 2-aminoethylphosphonate ABC transporter substrate-binding protein [Armatimonadota bacterium]MDR7548790.1 putative 2-aminoethylphosphonate ABC transporter substrate-binding protein [Armatimonadota bacterium]